MNVFILNTGRCGSTTFIKACSHIGNYTSAHESLSNLLGEQRLNYPRDHIEADNRLSWFLGRLDDTFGSSAFYVHLKRDKQQTIDSFSQRSEFGIMKAYKEGILLGDTGMHSATQIADDYITTIDSNIRLFLKDKTHKMDFNLNSARQDFQLFWERISAQGNIELALKEWDINYNKTN